MFYTRRDLGFDHLKETYNLSGGWIYPVWELHLTAFAPDFVRHMGSDEKGFAAYYRTPVAERHAGAGRRRSGSPTRRA